MKSVIFDTDIGIDDAMALLLLHCAADIELLAITTRFGNASIDDTTRNALAVTEKFDIAAPVYRGAADAMGERLGDGYPAHVHGRDGLGEIGLPPPTRREGELSAAQALVELSRAATNPLTIVAVGGMTNIAQALALDATLPERIEEMIVMGGAFGYRGHRGNVSPVAEANIASDPSAADIVFTSGINSTIVGLDVTHEVKMDGAFMDRLASGGGAVGEFIRELYRYYLNFYRSISGRYECPVHDSSAVAWLLAPELYECIEQPVRVVTGGIAIGQTIHGDDLRDYVSTEWEQRPKTRVCTAVNAQGVLDLLFSTLVDAP